MARDLGTMLGTGGMLAGLRETAFGVPPASSGDRPRGGAGVF